MTLFVSVNRVVPEPAGDSLPALDAELRAALGVKCFGLDYHEGVIRVQLVDNADASDQNSAVTIVNAHDFAIRTPAQAARTQAALDLAALIAQAQTLISQCNTGETDCDMDRTNLAAAGSLATVKPIVDNMLVRQKQTLVGLEKVIRGLLILNG